MNFKAPDAELRRAFTKADQHTILLRQSVRGADEVFRAYCAGPQCTELLAFLDVDGRWKKLRPFDFDHVIEREAGGETTAANGQALCSGPLTCHAAKSGEWAAISAKADRMGGRSGQAARRAARKARGERGHWGKR